MITIVGTRPEIIRLSRVIPALDERFEHILVHTGQNYDSSLSDVFFSDLKLRRPDVFLNVSHESLGSMLGDILVKIESVFTEHEPDAVLILGDTNSSIAAVMAKRMHIPVYHMEAGNRSFDENVPEETNRRLVDHVADFNLAYTEHARRNLLAEGLRPRNTVVIGSPMREVLAYYEKEIQNSSVLRELSLEKGGYFLVSAHRQENVDDPERLRRLLETLQKIHKIWQIPVLISTHPRTRDRLAALTGFEGLDGLTFHEPFGFFDYNHLQVNARAVLSDSGTISEESAILNFPAVTIRDSMERPEALEWGTIVLSGLGARDVIAALEEAISNHSDVPKPLPAGYEVLNVADRVTRFMLSTAGRHALWFGLNSKKQKS